MASEIFHVVKGEWRTLVDNVIAGSPTNSRLFVAYYKAIEADSTLITRTDKADLEAEAGNTICDFDNYSEPHNLASVTINDSSGEIWADAADMTISAAGSAGGGTNNTILKAVLYYIADHTGSLTGAIPIAYYDFDMLTNGTDLKFQIPTSGLCRI